MALDRTRRVVVRRRLDEPSSVWPLTALWGPPPRSIKDTAEFGGTSSASPIVSGAAILLQSIYKVRHDRVLSPTALRALLRKTGSAQTNGPYGSAKKKPIGPRPDLEAALAELP